MNELVEFGELTETDRAELEGEEGDPFDALGGRLQFRGKERHVALRDRGGRLIAAAGLTVSEVEVASARFPVVGIGGVIVNHEHRGTGLARTVMNAALDRARAMGPDFAILFCHADRAELYRRLGFRVIEERVLVRQPHGYAPMSQRTMWLGLRPGRGWPTGPPVVHTLPF
jgi:predicted N-acetyltransferase YhbS